MSTSDVCFVCLARLYEMFVGTLISLTNAIAGCARPTLNYIEPFDLGRSVPTAKPLHLVSVVRNVPYLQNVNQISMNMNLKMFCILCLLLSFFVLFYATQVKRQIILLLIWNSLIMSSDFVVICCMGTMKIKDCRTNDIRFISKLWCARGSKCNFWSRDRFRWRCHW